MNSVLVVDDDSDLCALLKTALERRGFVVFVAPDSKTADRILNESAVDVAVIDGLLPDESGVDFISRLRSQGSRIHIVFISAHFRDLKTLNRLTEALCVSIVAYKPLDTEHFAERILELVRSPETRVGTAPADPVDSAQSMLEVLVNEFTQRLSQKVAEIQEALRAARTEPTRATDARVLAHKLRGSAGSYGYPAVSEAAGVLEDLLDSALSGGREERFFWERVERAMHDLAVSANFERRSSMRYSDRAESTTKRVLVIHNDNEFLQLVTVVARRLLVQVLSARSAEEALDWANRYSLLAVVFEIQSGEDRWFDVARALRQTPSNSNTAIAFASNDRSIETRVAALEAGATKFFQKPISEAAFGDILLQILRASEERLGHVLIVDDDPDVIDRYSQCLTEASLVVDHLTSAEGLVDRLEESRIDVLLLDIELPRISGIDVCRALRMSEQWELLPILIMSAHVDAATRLRAFRAGASDVIAKPVLPEELLARVTVQEERVRLLRERAYNDALSGLLLRRALLDAFQRVLALCTRDNKPLSIVLFDIDQFKLINDTYGHLAGDRVISGLGELMRRRFRTEDLRARWGGEEFLLVLPGAARAAAQEAAERLLADFATLVFVSDDNRPFSATFTGGVAQFPEDGTSIVTLIRYADELLYAGKHAGRNRIMCGSLNAERDDGI
jgi:diguanylate cyclase (GGDEF)-like protein